MRRSFSTGWPFSRSSRRCESPRRACPIGPGLPEGCARIEGYYAVDKRAVRWRRRARGPRHRVSWENNPMDETLCIWHIAAGKIRAWTSAEPRSDRARTTGEGRVGCDGRPGAAREKTREGYQRMNPLRGFAYIDLSTKRGVTRHTALEPWQSEGPGPRRAPAP